MFALLDARGAVFLHSDSVAHAAFAVDMRRMKVARRVFVPLDRIARAVTRPVLRGPKSTAEAARRKQSISERIVRRVTGAGFELAVTRMLFGAARVCGIGALSVYGLAGATIRDVDYTSDLRAMMPESVPWLLADSPEPSFWTEYVGCG